MAEEADSNYYYNDYGDSLNPQPVVVSTTESSYILGGAAVTEAAPYDPSEEDGPRYAWKVTSWIIVALTLILNLVIVIVIVINRNANSVINKGKITL